MTLRKHHIYYYYRLLKWRLLGDRSPIGASIKITQRCNLSCKHCSWEKKQHDELSFNEWKTIIDDLYKKGVTVIAVEGGEPTLHKDSARIVDYIKKRGLFCIYVTNGTLDISHICPDVFWISIDGMEQSHDAIRGSGIFNKVVATIEKSRERKMISLTSLSQTNVSDVEHFCEYFSPRLHGLMFSFTYPYSAIKEEILNKQERKRVAQQLLQLKQKYPNLINSSSYLKEVGNKKGIYPWLLTTVTSNGKQVQGCMIRHMEKENCALCDMGCCAELSKIYELKHDAVEFWNVNIGLPRFI
jgi:MoaA/NifB/PqqE/SkfB family radical SAM enzyme